MFPFHININSTLSWAKMQNLHYSCWFKTIYLSSTISLISENKVLPSIFLKSCLSKISSKVYYLKLEFLCRGPMHSYDFRASLTNPSLPCFTWFSELCQNHTSGSLPVHLMLSRENLYKLKTDVQEVFLNQSNRIYI